MKKYTMLTLFLLSGQLYSDDAKENASTNGHNADNISVSIEQIFAKLNSAQNYVQQWKVQSKRFADKEYANKLAKSFDLKAQALAKEPSPNIKEIELCKIRANHLRTVLSEDKIWNEVYELEFGDISKWELRSKESTFSDASTPSRYFPVNRNLFARGSVDNNHINATDDKILFILNNHIGSVNLLTSTLIDTVPIKSWKLVLTEQGQYLMTCHASKLDIEIYLDRGTLNVEKISCAQKNGKLHTLIEVNPDNENQIKAQYYRGATGVLATECIWESEGLKEIKRLGDDVASLKPGGFVTLEINGKRHQDLKTDDFIKNK